MKPLLGKDHRLRTVRPHGGPGGMILREVWDPIRTFQRFPVERQQRAHVSRHSHVDLHFSFDTIVTNTNQLYSDFRTPRRFAVEVHSASHALPWETQAHNMHNLSKKWLREGHYRCVAAKGSSFSTRTAGSGLPNTSQLHFLPSHLFHGGDTATSWAAPYHTRNTAARINLVNTTVAVIGHSRGGLTALAAARQSGEDSREVRPPPRHASPPSVRHMCCGANRGSRARGGNRGIWLSARYSLKAGGGCTSRATDGPADLRGWHPNKTTRPT